MSIDLSQFHQVFFEESFEGLQVMESSLLDLDCESVDSETINSIFRAAHSIKGSSSTFGFVDVAVIQCCDGQWCCKVQIVGAKRHSNFFDDRDICVTMN